MAPTLFIHTIKRAANATLYLEKLHLIKAQSITNKNLHPWIHSLPSHQSGSGLDPRNLDLPA